jgi:hypothetical protein
MPLRRKSSKFLPRKFEPGIFFMKKELFVKGNVKLSQNLVYWSCEKCIKTVVKLLGQYNWTSIVT